MGNASALGLTSRETQTTVWLLHTHVHGANRQSLARFSMLILYQRRGHLFAGICLQTLIPLSAGWDYLPLATSRHAMPRTDHNPH